MKLLTPGPVPLPEAVAEAMALQPLHHHSQEFLEIASMCWKGLQQIVGTAQPVLLIGGSATVGIEAAVQTVHGTGAHVAVISHGHFGQRIVSLVSRCCSAITVHEVPWGDTFTVDQIETIFKNISKPDAIWMVQSETSTGVTLDLDAIVPQIRSVWPDALICIDAVTGIGIHRFEFDTLGADVVVAGSQKGLLSPPGLAAVALSKRAWDAAAASSQASSLSLNLFRVLEAYQKGRFSWTPPVTLVRALSVAVDLILKRGLPSTWTHHEHLTEFLHQELRQRHFEIFGKATSHAVTVVKVNNAPTIIHRLAHEHGFVVAGGHEELQSSVLRIGTCGAVSREDLAECCSALDHTIHQSRV